MAYTAKYASAFYGPFREALASAPKPGMHVTLLLHWLVTASLLECWSVDGQTGDPASMALHHLLCTVMSSCGCLHCDTLISCL